MTKLTKKYSCSIKVQEFGLNLNRREKFQLKEMTTKSHKLENRSSLFLEVSYQAQGQIKFITEKLMDTL